MAADEPKVEDLMQALQDSIDKAKAARDREVRRRAFKPCVDSWIGPCCTKPEDCVYGTKAGA